MLHDAQAASPRGYAWPSLRVAEPEEFCLADGFQFGLPLRLIPQSRTGSRCFINLVVGGDRASAMFGGREHPENCRLLKLGNHFGL